MSVVVGSSPLTRGGLGSEFPFTWLEGLIPAYAGRTGIHSAWSKSPGAHPRLRGADN
ncbi:conserved hypothetical protein [Corynebacterium striatum]|nr:conserved hypothetical protein [Corynebacterium striatum]